MSSSSSRPLPHLPLETQAAILRYCDRPTLAVSSRVSLAWLELSIPILHEDIYADRLETLEMLLCSRNAHAPSAVDAVLSLNQVRTLTIVCLDVTDNKIELSRHRLPDKQCLVVSRLVLVASHDDGGDPTDPWSNLLHFFDPETVRLKFVTSPEPLNSHLNVDLDRAPWFRLRTVEFVACTSLSVFGMADLFRRTFHAEDTVPLTVVYDLAEAGWDADLWFAFVSDIVEDEPGRDMFGPASRLAKIVVRLRTLAARAAAQEALADQITHLSIEERDRRNSFITFEVAEPVKDANMS